MHPKEMQPMPTITSFFILLLLPATASLAVIVCTRRRAFTPLLFKTLKWVFPVLQYPCNLITIRDQKVMFEGDHRSWARLMVQIFHSGSQKWLKNKIKTELQNLCVILRLIQIHEDLRADEHKDKIFSVITKRRVKEWIPQSRYCLIDFFRERSNSRLWYHCRLNRWSQIAAQALDRMLKVHSNATYVCFTRNLSYTSLLLLSTSLCRVQTLLLCRNISHSRRSPRHRDSNRTRK